MERQASLRSNNLSSKICDVGDNVSTDNKTLILPRCLVGEDRREVRIVIFRDPKTAKGMYCLEDKTLKKYYQLMRFENSPSSFFVDDTVHKDGSLTLVTEIDPLYLVLPYFIQSTKYRPLDQILVDEQFRDCSLLISEDIHKRILSLANTKESGDLKVYCYDWDKCKLWLKKKVDLLVSELEKQNVLVSNSGAQVTTFIRKRNRVSDTDEYTRYAHGIISEYLPNEISAKLFDYLGLKPFESAPKEESEFSQSPRKKLKVESKKGEPDEDYYVENKLTKKNDKSKISASHRALSKVDKTGMKNISSFFKKM